MADSFATTWTVARQTPLSMGFSRQEYWSGWPFPSHRDLPNPVIKPMSLASAGGFFTTDSPRKFITMLANVMACYIDLCSTFKLKFPE